MAREQRPRRNRWTDQARGFYLPLPEHAHGFTHRPLAVYEAEQRPSADGTPRTDLHITGPAEAMRAGYDDHVEWGVSPFRDDWVCVDGPARIVDYAEYDRLLAGLEAAGKLVRTSSGGIEYLKTSREEWARATGVTEDAFTRAEPAP